MPEEKDKCNCWDEMDERLKEQDLKISDACNVFSLHTGHVGLRRCLPLTTLTGKKPKVSVPRLITISHCPFCGKEL